MKCLIHDCEPWQSYSTRKTTMEQVWTKLARWILSIHSEGGPHHGDNPKTCQGWGTQCHQHRGNICSSNEPTQHLSRHGPDYSDVLRIVSSSYGILRWPRRYAPDRFQIHTEERSQGWNCSENSARTHRRDCARWMCCTMGHSVATH